MKQPDTAALRERLANYTPEDELEQDKQELDGLLQEVNCQLIEFRAYSGGYPFSISGDIRSVPS